MCSNVHSQIDKPQTDWTSCPPGELQRLVGKLNVIEQCAQRKRICYCGVGAVVMVAVLVIGIGTLLTPDATNYGGLTCQQCQSHFVAFRDHMVGIQNVQTSALVETLKSDDTEVMDSALAEKMSTHLANCQHCGKQFNSRYPGIKANYQTREANYQARERNYQARERNYQARERKYQISLAVAYLGPSSTE